MLFKSRAIIYDSRGLLTHNARPSHDGLGDGFERLESRQREDPGWSTRDLL